MQHRVFELSMILSLFAFALMSAAVAIACAVGVIMGDYIFILPGFVSTLICVGAIIQLIVLREG